MRSGLGGADVAETAFLRAGHPLDWCFRRQPSDEGAEVVDELVVHRLCRYAYRVVSVGNLATEFHVPVPFEGLGDSVQVDHHLDKMAGALLSCLRVDDYGVVVSLGDEVWLSTQGR